jgi:hypothetical protein
MLMVLVLGSVADLYEKEKNVALLFAFSATIQLDGNSS